MRAVHERGAAPYKVRWGPGETLIRQSSHHLGQIILSKVTNDANESQKVEVIKSLQKQASMTDVIQQEGQVPIAYPSTKLFSYELIPDVSSEGLVKEAQLWRLASILYDPVAVQLPENTDSHLVEYAASRIRKSRLSVWFQENVSEQTANDLRNSRVVAERIYFLLSGYNIEDACVEAISERDFRLGTLLPLAGGDDELRSNMREEIQNWTENGCLAHVAIPYRAIYELISGNVNISVGYGKIGSPEYAREFGVCESLDWLRAAAVRLWYESKEDSHLSEFIKSYEFSFLNLSSVKPPLPWHGQINVDEAIKNKTYDGFYQLLKLYSSPDSDLSDILQPLSYSESKLDSRLIWQLYSVLCCGLGMGDFNDRAIVTVKNGNKESSVRGASMSADQLCVSFAAELEAKGLWQWSIFVLMHLEHPNSREIGIRELLARNVMAYKDNENARRFLINEFKIEESLLQDAITLHDSYITSYKRVGPKEVS